MALFKPFFVYCGMSGMLLILPLYCRSSLRKYAPCIPNHQTKSLFLPPFFILSTNSISIFLLENFTTMYYMIRTTSLFMTVSPKNLFFKKNVKEKVSALLVHTWHAFKCARKSAKLIKAPYSASSFLLSEGKCWNISL